MIAAHQNQRSVRIVCLIEAKCLPAKNGGAVDFIPLCHAHRSDVRNGGNNGAQTRQDLLSAAFAQISSGAFGRQLGVTERDVEAADGLLQAGMNILIQGVLHLQIAQRGAQTHSQQEKRQKQGAMECRRSFH